MYSTHVRTLSHSLTSQTSNSYIINIHETTLTHFIVNIYYYYYQSCLATQMQVPCDKHLAIKVQDVLFDIYFGYQIFQSTLS